MGRKTSLIIVLMMMSASWAITKSAYDAQHIVQDWLLTEPFEEDLGQVGTVQTYADARGVLYYVVDLEPTGFVIVSPDDALQPIIAFSTGEFDPDSPLATLASKDLSKRLATLPEDSVNRWFVMADVDEVIVAPLTKSKWGQTLSSQNEACFNYYTPQAYWKTYPESIRVIQLPGDAMNFPAGCVAIAMAQLMYYHQYPPQTTPMAFDVGYIVSNRYFTGTMTSMGGPYQWDLMSNSPGANASELQRQAIGELCYDVGLSVGTYYGKSGSGARTSTTARALTETFHYRSAVSGQFDLDNVNPNLLAGYPVLITIRNDDLAHAVIIDGYGLQGGEQYHHLNMGWKGSGDTWYALPDVQSFDVIDECVYNIYPAADPPAVTPVVPPVVPPVAPIVEVHKHRWTMSRVSISVSGDALIFSVPCEDCDMVCTGDGNWQAQ